MNGEFFLKNAFFRPKFGVFFLRKRKFWKLGKSSQCDVERLWKGNFSLEPHLKKKWKAANLESGKILVVAVCLVYIAQQLYQFFPILKKNRFFFKECKRFFLKKELFSCVFF